MRDEIEMKRGGNGGLMYQRTQPEPVQRERGVTFCGQLSAVGNRHQITHPPAVGQLDSAVIALV